MAYYPFSWLYNSGEYQYNDTDILLYNYLNIVDPECDFYDFEAAYDSDYDYDEPCMPYDPGGERPFSTSAVIPWIPRWMIAHYSESSQLRRLYLHGIHNGSLELFDRLGAKMSFGFYNSTSYDRVAFGGRWTGDLTNMPQVTLVASATASAIKQVRTMGDLLYEKLDPVVLVNSNVLLIKNATIVYDCLSSDDGSIDYTDLASQHPLISDTAFFIQDPNGMIFTVHQEDPRHNATEHRIYIGNHGTYCLHYHSQLKLDRLLDGRDYIMVGNELLDIYETSLPNSWDECGRLFALERKGNETNDALAKRCQTFAISRTAKERISSSLNTSIPILWNTSSTLTLTGSGITSISTPFIPELEHIVEVPIINNETLYLTRSPDTDKAVLVLLDNIPLSPDLYTVSNNTITLPSQYSGLSPRRVVVRYTSSPLTKTISSGTVTAVSRSHEGSESVYAVGSTGVEITNQEYKATSFKWNRVPARLVGTSTFDF